jgi:hypothetical protein
MANCDTMGERMGRIGQIQTDFSCHSACHSEGILKRTKDSFGMTCGMTRKIRLNLLNPPYPFSHCITIYKQGNFKSLLNGIAAHPSG